MPAPRGPIAETIRSPSDGANVAAGMVIRGGAAAAGPAGAAAAGAATRAGDGGGRFGGGVSAGAALATAAGASGFIEAAAAATSPVDGPAVADGGMAPEGFAIAPLIACWAGDCAMSGEPAYAAFVINAGAFCSVTCVGEKACSCVGCAASAAAGRAVGSGTAAVCTGAGVSTGWSLPPGSCPANF